MGPANMKKYQLFLLEYTEWFPQNTLTCLKNNTWGSNFYCISYLNVVSRYKSWKSGKWYTGPFIGQL